MATWCFNSDSHFLQKEKKPTILFSSSPLRKKAVHFREADGSLLLWVNSQLFVGVAPSQEIQVTSRKHFPKKSSLAMDSLCTTGIWQSEEREKFASSWNCSQRYKKKEATQIVTWLGWKQSRADPSPKGGSSSSSGRLYSCSLNAQHHIPIPQHQGTESTRNFTLSHKLCPKHWHGWHSHYNSMIWGCITDHTAACTAAHPWRPRKMAHWYISIDLVTVNLGTSSLGTAWRVCWGCQKGDSGVWNSLEERGDERQHRG